MVKMGKYLVLWYCICCFYCVCCYNILGVCWFPSKSHQMTFQPIWRELSLRGHQMTVITPVPLNDPTLTNLTELDVSYLFEVLKNNNFIKNYSKNNWIWNSIIFLKYLKEELVVSMMKDGEIQKLISSKLEFDLVIVEPHHPFLFAFGERYKAPVVGMYDNSFSFYYIEYLHSFFTCRN